MIYARHDSPVGPLMLTAEGESLTGVWFCDDEGPEPPTAAREDREALSGVISSLDAYFAGTLRDFVLALRPSGTPFRLRVWEQLRAIPYGETISYGELARRVGNPSAARAVGMANRANPLAIVVPCHRVIGADGSLTGYGGGLERKRYLLELEARTRA